MYRVILLALLLFPGFALATTAPPTATQIVARTKTAMGGSAWDHIHNMRAEGSMTVNGHSWPTTFLQDFLTGRYVNHTQVKIGSRNVVSGFDGKVSWTRRPYGKVLRYTSAKANVTTAYIVANGSWYPKRWPAKADFLGIRKDAGVKFQILRITPQGGNPFQFWVNAKTHFITRIVRSSGSDGTATNYFSDFRKVDGVMIPFHEVDQIGNTTHKIITQVQKVTFNVPVSAEDFAVPKQH